VSNFDDQDMDVEHDLDIESDEDELVAISEVNL